MANWNATKKVKVKGHDVECLLFLDYSEELGDHIRIQAMLNEYCLTDTVTVGSDDRDFMYSLIQNFPIRTLQSRLEVLAWDNGAIE